MYKRNIFCLLIAVLIGFTGCSKSAEMPKIIVENKADSVIENKSASTDKPVITKSETPKIAVNNPIPTKESVAVTIPIDRPFEFSKDETGQLLQAVLAPRGFSPVDPIAVHSTQVVLEMTDAILPYGMPAMVRIWDPIRLPKSEPIMLKVAEPTGKSIDLPISEIPLPVEVTVWKVADGFGLPSLNSANVHPPLLANQREFRFPFTDPTAEVSFQRMQSKELGLITLQSPIRNEKSVKMKVKPTDPNQKDLLLEVPMLP